MNVLHKLWRFTKFITSRWLSVGRSCRTFVCGLLTGLDTVAWQVINDDGQSKFKIKGYKQLAWEGRRSICIASLASYPADNVMRCLINDNRVTKVRDELVAEARSGA